MPKPRKQISCKRSSDPEEMGRNYAQAITAPEVGAHRIMMAVEPSSLTEPVDVPGMLLLLREQIAVVNEGDLAHCEAMLMGQAVALQSLFVRLTERGMNQQHLPNMSSFLKLALRAQSQCRATLEALASIKNPPVVIARQANIAAGPQQINNGGPLPLHAGDFENAPNKLLEHDHGKRLDPRAASPTGRADSELAAVGALDRSHE